MPAADTADTAITRSQRVRIDEYGSGREIEVTVWARRIAPDEITGPHSDLDPDVEYDAEIIAYRIANPWKVEVNATELTYGAGGAVLNRNDLDFDPYGELWNELTAERPSDERLASAADDFLGYARESLEQWAQQRRGGKPDPARSDATAQEARW